MKFCRIELKNYRQFRDLKIDLDSPSEYDINIIVASNGLGKTNLLNAISWCIYGKEPSLEEKYDVMHMVNTKILEENGYSGIFEVSVKIKSRKKDENGTEEYFFERIANYRYSGDPSQATLISNDFKITIFKDGYEAKVLETHDDTTLFINRHFPENIKEYIFFDGERLNDYFVKEKGSAIKSAVELVSGISLLNVIIDRFKIIRTEYSRQIAKDHPEIDKIQKEIDKTKFDIQNAINDSNTYKDQIHKAENDIKIIKDRLRGCEGLSEKIDRRDKLEKQRADYRKRLKEANEKLYSFVIEYYPIMKFYPAFQKLNSFIKKQNCDDTQPLITDNLDILYEMINNMKCSLCNNALSADQIKLFEQRILQLKENNKGKSFQLSKLLSRLSYLVEEKIESFENYHDEKEKIFSDIKHYERELNVLENEINDIQRFLLSTSNPENIRRDEQRLAELTEMRDTNLVKKGRNDERINELNKKLNNLQIELNNALYTLNTNKNIEKAIQVTDNAIKVLTEIKEENTAEIREEINKKTNKIFKELLWKKHTFDRVEIDENYKISVYHVSGQLGLGTMGAAETALLALSFMIAMQEVSGFKSAIIMDTPLARVSDKHRKSFAKSLLEVSRKKQILLLLTPSEYSEEMKAVLHDNFNNLYAFYTENEENTLLKRGE